MVVEVVIPVTPPRVTSKKISTTIMDFFSSSSSKVTPKEEETPTRSTNGGSNSSGRVTRSSTKRTSGVDSANNSNASTRSLYSDSNTDSSSKRSRCSLNESPTSLKWDDDNDDDLDLDDELPSFSSILGGASQANSKNNGLIEAQNVLAKLKNQSREISDGKAIMEQLNKDVANVAVEEAQIENEKNFDLSLEMEEDLGIQEKTWSLGFFNDWSNAALKFPTQLIGIGLSNISSLNNYDPTVNVLLNIFGIDSASTEMTPNQINMFLEIFGGGSWLQRISENWTLDNVPPQICEWLYNHACYLCAPGFEMASLGCYRLLLKMMINTANSTEAATTCTKTVNWCFDLGVLMETLRRFGHTGNRKNGTHLENNYNDSSVSPPQQQTNANYQPPTIPITNFMQCLHLFTTSLGIKLHEWKDSEDFINYFLVLIRLKLDESLLHHAWDIENFFLPLFQSQIWQSDPFLVKNLCSKLKEEFNQDPWMQLQVLRCIPKCHKQAVYVLDELTCGLIATCYTITPSEMDNLEEFDQSIVKFFPLFVFAVQMKRNPNLTQQYSDLYLILNAAVYALSCFVWDNPATDKILSKYWEHLEKFSLHGKTVNPLDRFKVSLRLKHLQFLLANTKPQTANKSIFDYLERKKALLNLEDDLI